MKTFKTLKLSHLFSAVCATVALSALVSPATVSGEVSTSAANRPLKIRIVNFKTCVEKSKMGQQEQGNFESLKKQMEGVLADKEKALVELATKCEDPDYFDSLSPEAEVEIKRKLRSMNQELSQMQNQYYQALSQTNVKVVQKLTDVVNESAATVAKKNGYDLVFSDESCFFSAPDLDISPMVVTIMDQKFEEAKSKEKDSATKPAK